MHVREVMTMDPISCLPSDSAQAAAELMRRHNTGVLPVVEARHNQRVVGVVTDRDLCMTVIADGKAPGTSLVKDSMTAQVVSCRPDDDVAKVEALMRENLIRRIPVISDRDTLQGIVSIADLLRKGDRQPTDPAGQALKEIAKPTSEASKPRAGQPAAA
jgi:CBS domain-containing protein